MRRLPQGRWANRATVNCRPPMFLRRARPCLWMLMSRPTCWSKPCSRSYSPSYPLPGALEAAATSAAIRDRFPPRDRMHPDRHTCTRTRSAGSPTSPRARTGLGRRRCSSTTVIATSTVSGTTSVLPVRAALVTGGGGGVRPNSFCRAVRPQLIPMSDASPGELQGPTVETAWSLLENRNRPARAHLRERSRMRADPLT